MRSLSSAETVTVSWSYDGYGSLQPDNLRNVGAIVVDVPFSPIIQEIPDTVSFNQSPRVVLNLGDCEHYKVSGMVYQPSNFGPITPSSIRSVYGPLYDQKGVARNIISRTASSAEHYVRLYGNYFDVEEGYWYFGIGAKRIGSRVYFAGAAPRLEGDRPNNGRYTMSVYEFRLDSGRIQYRQDSFDTLGYGVNLETHSPLKAIDFFIEHANARLDGLSWSNWRGGVFTAPPFDLRRINIPTRYEVFPEADCHVDWGSLAADAYNSVPFFSSNGVAYAKDLVSLKRDAESTLRMIQALGTKGKLAAKAAQLFLSFHYGWKLFVSDTAELVDAQKKINKSSNLLNRATSQRSWSAHGASYRAVLQCYYRRYAYASAADQFVLNYDLALTPENLWDLIPFSFVVDWFTGIGNVLEDMSNYYTFTQKHEVLCTGRSIKAVKQVAANKLHRGLAGVITFSYYSRNYSPYAVRPTFHFSNSVNPLDHVVEGSALIVSRR